MTGLIQQHVDERRNRNKGEIQQHNRRPLRLSMGTIKHRRGRRAAQDSLRHLVAGWTGIAAPTTVGPMIINYRPQTRPMPPRAPFKVPIYLFLPPFAPMRGR